MEKITWLKKQFKNIFFRSQHYLPSFNNLKGDISTISGWSEPCTSSGAPSCSPNPMLCTLLLKRKLGQKMAAEAGSPAPTLWFLFNLEFEQLALLSHPHPVWVTIVENKWRVCSQCLTPSWETEVKDYKYLAVQHFIWSQSLPQRKLREYSMEYQALPTLSKVALWPRGE